MAFIRNSVDETLNDINIIEKLHFDKNIQINHEELVDSELLMINEGIVKITMQAEKQPSLTQYLHSGDLFSLFGPEQILSIETMTPVKMSCLRTFYTQRKYKAKETLMNKISRWGREQLGPFSFKWPSSLFSKEPADLTIK